jgi:hypothetical protein
MMAITSPATGVQPTAGRRAATGSSIPARHGHALVYDSALRTTLIFGGLDAFFTPMDLWAWDGTNWAQIPSVNAPLTRERFATTYDPGRDRSWCLADSPTSMACSTTSGNGRNPVGQSHAEDRAGSTATLG